MQKFFRLLLVEDDEERVTTFQSWLPDAVRLVRAPSARAALEIIQRDPGQVYGGVLLDHDLGQRALTEADQTLSGTQVARALIRYFSPDVPILVHSNNHTQVPALVRTLQAQGFWVTRIPYYSLTQEAFQAWLEEARALWADLTQT